MFSVAFVIIVIILLVELNSVPAITFAVQKGALASQPTFTSAACPPTFPPGASGAQFANQQNFGVPNNNLWKLPVPPSSQNIFGNDVQKQPEKQFNESIDVPTSNLRQPTPAPLQSHFHQALPPSTSKAPYHNPFPPPPQQAPFPQSLGLSQPFFQQTVSPQQQSSERRSVPMGQQGPYQVQQRHAVANAAAPFDGRLLPPDVVSGVMLEQDSVQSQVRTPVEGSDLPVVQQQQSFRWHLNNETDAERSGYESCGSSAYPDFIPLNPAFGAPEPTDVMDCRGAASRVEASVDPYLSGHDLVRAKTPEVCFS